MATFKDTMGREWKLRLNVGLLGEVKREAAIDLGLVAQDLSWVEMLFGKFEKLIQVLWVLCADQAAAIPITPEEFPYGFDGEVLELAGSALTEAIADFYPRSKIARALKEKLPAIMAETDNRAIAELERLTSMFLTSASSTPASPASIPAG